LRTLRDVSILTAASAKTGGADKRALMPIYEYSCGSCGHEFDEFSPKMSDDSPATCPKCQKRGARRKVSVFAARMGSSRPSSVAPTGGCGRCGDPNGPCSI